MHEPYVRIVPGAKNAVVFVHGIVSTPRYWDAFVAATPPDWSVHSLLLPGHGGSVMDFGRTKWGEWRRHVTAVIDGMRDRHERVYIVAHSLGTLLTVQSVLERPEKIAGLLLLAMPLRIFVKPASVVHNIAKGLGLAENPEELAQYYGTAQDWRVWRYIGWIPRYLELFAISRDVRRRMAEMSIPAQVFMSGKDELVSLRSCRVLEKCPAVTLTILPDSMHHELAEADDAQVMEAFRRMCGESK